MSDGRGKLAVGQAIVVVGSGLQLPADVAFAIDESGSMGSSIADVKASVTRGQKAAFSQQTLGTKSVAIRRGMVSGISRTCASYEERVQGRSVGFVV